MKDKNKKLYIGIGIVLFVTIIAIVSVFIYSKKQNETNTFGETLSQKELEKREKQQIEQMQKIKENTSSKEKVMKVYEKGESLFGNTDECKHMWMMDDKEDNTDDNNLHFKCNNCNKKVKSDLLTYDVWQDITFMGEEKSTYLNQFEKETDANVTFENESKE